MSTKSIAGKLLIKPATNVWSSHPERLELIEPLPKANRTDINRDSVWPILAESRMRPIGQVSLGDVWSAMRFRPDRPGEAPFRGGAKS